MRPLRETTIRVTEEEAAAAYPLVGERVPQNLREPWPWPQAAALIGSLCIGFYLGVGAAAGFFGQLLP